MFPNEKGFSYRNIRYIKQWYLFYYEEFTKWRQAGAKLPNSKIHQLGAKLLQQPAAEIAQEKLQQPAAELSFLNRQQPTDELQMPDNFVSAACSHYWFAALSDQE